MTSTTHRRERAAAATATKIQNQPPPPPSPFPISNNPSGQNSANPFQQSMVAGPSHAPMVAGPSHAPMVAKLSDASNPSPRAQTAEIYAQLATIPGYRQSSVQPVPAIGSAAVAALRAQADAIQLQPLRRYRQSGQAAPRPAIVGTAAVTAMQAQADEIGQGVYGIARPPSQPFNPPALLAPNPQPHPIPQQPPQQPPQPLSAPQQPLNIPLGHSRIIEADIHPHDLGPMNIVCPDCDALHWKVEHLHSSTNR